MNDSREAMAQGLASGLIRPSRDEEARLRFLVYQGIGALAVQFVTAPHATSKEFLASLNSGQADYLLPQLELYTEGLLTSRQLLDDYVTFQRQSAPVGPADPRIRERLSPAAPVRKQGRMTQILQVPSTSTLAVEVHGLTKSFGRVHALRGLDLSVPVGQVTGFLGPNGSGKTTTIRILLGLLRADGGQAVVLGGDPWADAVRLHRAIAYVPGDVTLWPNLTGGEAIDILCRLSEPLEPGA